MPNDALLTPLRERLRTLTENSRPLKFDTHGFEKE